jgi:hypothetical protein
LSEGIAVGFGLGCRVVQRGTPRSGPSTPRSDRHSRSVLLASHGCGIDIERQGHRGEGLAFAVTAGGLVHVVVAHLAAVHSSLDAASFEVCGDGPTVDAELRCEIGQRPSCLVLTHELVDLDLAQPTGLWRGLESCPGVS